MKSKRKDYLIIGSIFLVIVITIVLMFYPELVGYSHSYVDLEDKKILIEVNNSNIVSNEQLILSKRAELEEIQDRRNDVLSETLELKRNINQDDFILRMPEFLISIEQEAYKNKIKLDIDYGEIVTIIDSEENEPEDVEDSNEDAEDQETSDEDVEENEESEGEEASDEVESVSGDEEESNEESSEEPENEQEDSDEEQDPDEEGEDVKIPISDEAIKLDGFDVTVIPIRIEGSYHNVRNYIKFLDEIGMIEPSSVSLKSEGKVIKGRVVLNIFHGEVL